MEVSVSILLRTSWNKNFRGKEEIIFRKLLTIQLKLKRSLSTRGSDVVK